MTTDDTIDVEVTDDDLPPEPRPADLAIRTSTFFDALYRGLDGTIEIRALPSKKKAWGKPGDYNPISTFCKNQAGNVYFGVALRKDATSGTLANCTILPALFVDIDFKDTSERDARHAVEYFPGSPSIIVSTGGGLHCYWLLEHPVDLRADLEQAETLLKHLATYLGADLACAEAARVLRLPGTKNRKYNPARAVTIERFETDCRYELSDFRWLLTAPEAKLNASEKTTTNAGTFDCTGKIETGTRNSTLYRLGRSLKSKGLPAGTILSTLQKVNEEQANPPLSPREVHAIANQVLGQADRDDFTSGNTAATPIITRLSTVEAVQVEWLWPGRPARGKYSLGAGDPGLGKSSLLLDCTARLSRPGSTWPDGAPCPHGPTLLLTAEDGLADTIRPRVDRYGGDASQVFVLEAVRDKGGKRPLDLARDIEVLIAAIREVRPALVGIDPITAYLGRTDAHRDAEVRGLLAPLMAALEEYRAALFAVAHLNKDATRAALHRPGGSVAFVAAARLAFAIAADPNDEDRRVLAPLKANICRKAEPLAFRFVNDALVWEDGPAAGMTADVLLRVTNSRDRDEETEAEQVIRDLLEDEAAWPMESKQVLAAGRAHGIPDRTMQHTARRLSIRIARVGFGRAGRWLWHRPPPIDATTPYLSDVASMASMTTIDATTNPIDAIDARKSAFPRAREAEPAADPEDEYAL